MAVKNRKSKTVNVNPRILISAFSAILVLALIITVASLQKPANRKSDVDFGKDVAAGIDVSEHNGDINWDKVKEEFDFAFIRVGYRGYEKGNIAEDKNAKENMKGAKKSDVPFGVYFYTQAVTEEEASQEAEFLIDKIKHYPVSLPVIIDFEYAFGSDGMPAGRLNEANLTPAEKAEVINAFFSVVKKNGYSYGLYASSSMLYSEIETSLLDEDAVIWVADYNNRVTYDVDYTVWQYTKTGKSDAVSSEYVDMNYWYSKKEG